MRDDTAPHLARSRRLMGLVGFVLVGGMWIYTAWTILDLRRQAWDSARHDAAGLLSTSERALARDIELYDLSLHTVAERMNLPVLEGVAPEVRHLSLFDRVSRARGYGSIFVLDQNGHAFLESGSLIARRLDGSDRRYFTIHRDRPDAGLFIGPPWHTRISGREMIPLSRRFAYADGSFAGVIVGAIELAYFKEVFQRLNSDAAFTVTLEFPDGSAVLDSRATGSAEPGLSIAQQVGAWPLRVRVSMPVSAIDEAWIPQARPILVIALALSLAILGVLLLLRRELTRRVLAERRAVAAQAEFERLAATDALTGLWNRRHFEEMLARCAEAADRRGWALLLADTDHFKRYNDRYGHPAGDRALERVAAILAEQAQGRGGSAFRIGGEEFALLATCAEEEAPALAEAVRAGVAALGLTHADHPRGILTLSIGLAHSAWDPGATTQDRLRSADEALYAAKRQGRDRVCLARPKRGSGPAGATEARAARAAAPAQVL